MSKTIIIKGKPCSGKSYLIRKIKNILHIDTPHKFGKYNYYSNGHLYLIGRYENNTYGGLDAFHPKGEAIRLIESIISEDPDAIIYCEGCITKVYPYDVKIYLQVDDDVLTKQLIERRHNAIVNKKTHFPELTDADIAHKLEIFVRHDVAAKNKNYTILPHNTQEQRDANLNLLLTYAK